MSKIVWVEDMPNYVTEERVKEFFSQKGEVTDVMLLTNKYAKSKRCGYVQFKTEHEAELAVNYFDYSLMDTCTIFCEIALKKDDEKKKSKKDVHPRLEKRLQLLQLSSSPLWDKVLQQ
ncbi:hypothetical protein CASFOL_017847 [Castilleja foliolosa]|uniref:RRM domain-containing protein n=1 Tax=Castilleja foliolosa TaxID=1961234 RepID=A0ABD3DA60_9LAMI